MTGRIDRAEKQQENLWDICFIGFFIFRRESMEQQEEKKIVERVSVGTIFGNFFLSLFKFVAGILARSQGLLSDAIDSLGDVLSSFIVMIGLRVSHKESDEGHPFGHERFEPIATLLLGMLLLASGCLIGYTAAKDIYLYFAKNMVREFNDFTLVALIAACVSIVGKEILYIFNYRVGKKIHSTALMASAWNFQIDVLSSIGALAGIIGAMCGVAILDSFASLIICIFILITSIRVFISAMNRLVDKSCDEKTIQKMKKIILSIPGVIDIDSIKTRMFGSKIYVEVEISVHGEITVIEGHAIAEEVHHQIEIQIEGVKHCIVHVNPKTYAAGD